MFKKHFIDLWSQFVGALPKINYFIEKYVQQGVAPEM